MWQTQVNGESENGWRVAGVQAAHDSLVMVSSGLEQACREYAYAVPIPGNSAGLQGWVNPASWGLSWGCRSLFRAPGDKTTHLLPEHSFLARNLKQKKRGLSELAALGHLLLVINDQWCAAAKSLSGACSACLTHCFVDCQPDCAQHGWQFGAAEAFVKADGNWDVNPVTTALFHCRRKPKQ